MSTLLRWCAALLLLYAALRWLLPALLPFLIALTGAVVIEPWVLFCLRRLRFKRKFSAVVFSTLLVGGILGVSAWLLLRLAAEAALWVGQLPAVLARLPEALSGIEAKFHTFLSACPDEVGQLIEEWALRLAEEGPALLGSLSGAVLSWTSGCLSCLPYWLLFAVTTLLAVYYTALSYPDIVRFVKRQIPARWQSYAKGVVGSLRSTLWKWLKAQSLLWLITFCFLLGGFWLMRLPYALLLAAAITFVDALPVLGTGTVLIPWALFHLLLGDLARCLALLALYAVITLTRSLLEPKLVASQVGLPPLAALIAMYVGYSLFGLGGMILLPMLLLFVKQLQDGGFIHLWR